VSGPAALKILVAGGDRRQMEGVAERLGHRVVLAGNGLEAVELFERERPDLVFMDLTLPVMDGSTALREIRALPTERWTPIVILSALDRLEDIMHGLDSGADDYLVEPFTLPMLSAKIGVYQRLLGLQRQARDHADELEAWRQRAEEQARLGGHVMASLTENSGLADPMLSHFNLPAEAFSGDLLCAGRTPGGVLYVMLADATGHGLPAALSALPVSQVFYSMTAKGFSLASIAEELNRKLKALLPTDRFVAATLAAVDVRNQTIEVWNGGNPDALLIDAEGRELRRFPSRHLPLGILAEERFDGETQGIGIAEPMELLLCSDGLVEAESPDGRRFGVDIVLEQLRRSPAEQRLTHLREGLNAHLAGGRASDDVSAMLLSIPLDRRQTVRSTAAEQVRQETVSQWRLDVSYGPQELRDIDVVPSMLDLLCQLSVAKPHKGALFLILSELFNNALDHGVLRLDSAIKGQDEGFDLYVRQRAERLETLSEGHIDLGFLLHTVDGGTVLDFRVCDSGRGFDYARYLSAPDDLGDSRPHGRGIALIGRLCREVRYGEAGREVRARYAL